MRILFLVVFTVLAVQLTAQNQSSSRQLLFRQLSLRDGLSQSTVNSIAQDRTGYIWVTTDDGLNKYDGSGFRVFRPQVNDSSAISAVDLLEIQMSIRGDMLIATRTGGLNVWDPLRQKATVFKERAGTSGVMLWNYIWDLAEDRYSRVWAASDSGLVLLNSDRTSMDWVDDSAIRLVAGQRLSYTAVSEIENEVYWMGVQSLGLVQYNLFDKSFSILADRRTEEFKDIVITTIYKESNGNIWVGTRHHGILHWKSGLKKWNKYSRETNSGLSSNWITSFVEDLEGNIWVGTRAGLSLYEEDEKRFTTFSLGSGNSEGLLEDNILCLFIDRSNNLWLGTRQKGVFIADLKKQKFDHFDFSKFGIKTPMANLVWNFTEDYNKNVWVGTEAGLIKLDQKLEYKEWFSSVHGNDHFHRAIKDDYVVALASIDDELWIGTGSQGLQRLNLKTNAMEFIDPSLQTGLISNRYTNNVKAIGNRIWVGTFGGLISINRKTLEILRHFPDNPSKDPVEVWDIEPDKQGDLWVATTRGIYILDSVGTFKRTYSVNASLQKNMNSIMHDSTLVWLSSSLGLIRVERTTGEYKLYGEESGLPNPFIYGVLSARPGEIWVSTNRGLSRVRYSYTDSDSITFRNYAHLDGVHNLEYNGGAFFKQSNGSLLFGGIAGVDIIKPENVYDNPFEPNVVVNEIGIFNGKNSKRIFLFDGKAVKLRYFENVFTIDVAALEFTQPELNRFAYKLEGFDNDWIQSSKKPFIVYTNLDAKRYVFKVRASNNDGTWTSRPTEFLIEIVPPFWKTMPFYAFCLLLVFSGVAVSVNLRERKLRVQNQLLEERVLLRTKELQESEEIFRLISETALDLISIVDEKGVILYANPAHEYILGYHESELMGQPMSRFVHPEDIERNRHYFIEMIARGRGAFPDYRIRHKNGNWLVFASSAARVAETGPGKQRFVMLSHDFSKQREITEQLTRSKEEAEQASRSKSAFLASMSHELKTPLNSILGFTQILQEDLTLSERHRNNLSTMYESGKQLLKMIEEILDLSKIEAGRMQVVRIDFELNQIFRELEARTKKRMAASSITYQLNLNNNLPGLCNTDYDKLLTVLYNLLDNAVKHAASGRIDVDAAYFAKMPARRKSLFDLKHLETLAPQKPGLNSVDMIRFVIRDTGSGLQEEELDSIFRPFNKSNPNFSRGIGLGLAISWRLISLMDGWLEIFAEENKGTEIHVWIPVMIPVALPAQPQVKLPQKDSYAAETTTTTAPHSEAAIDSVSAVLEVIRNWSEPEQREELLDSIELMDAEMMERVLLKMQDDRLDPLLNAARTRNFSLLISLNERLHPVG